MSGNAGYIDSAYLAGHASPRKRRHWTKSQAHLIGGALSGGIVGIVNLLIAIPDYYTTHGCPANPPDGSVCSNPEVYPSYALGIGVGAIALTAVLLACCAASRLRSHGVHRRFRKESARRRATEKRAESRNIDTGDIISDQVDEVLGMQVRYITGGFGITT
jgi:hypothetical protein